MTNWSPGDNVRLVTENFVLRSLEPTDVSDRFMSWIGNPKLMESLRSTPRTSRKRALRRISMTDNDNDFILGIYPQDTGALVGWIRIDYTPAHRYARVALLIGEKLYRGRGNTDELQRAVHDFCFRVLGVRKAIAAVNADEVHGRRLAERCGYQLEVLLRGHEMASDGSWRDIAYYGLLENEWRATRERADTG